jgi:uncharacterized protein DUF481
MHTRFMLALCAAITALSLHARADEIQFTNGDKLTGTIVKLKDGKLGFKSNMAGAIDVNWSDVATLSSDTPVTLQLQGGSIVVDKLVASEPGTVKTAGNDKLVQQTIQLASTEKLNPEPVEWHGTVIAGVDVERGNTVKTGANAKVDAVRRSEQDRITFGAEYDGEQTGAAGSREQETTERKLKGLLQYDYFFTKKLFGYTNATGEKDGVANLALRFTAGAGGGYQWYETDTFKWNTQLGLSWISENYTLTTHDQLIGTPDPDRDYIAARLASDLSYVLYPGLSFFQKTAFYPSLERWEDQLLVTSTGIRYKLFGNFYGESRVDWTWDRTPAPGKLENDVAYIIGIGYGF